MKIPSLLACAVLACGVAATAPAQDAKPDLVRAMETLKAAPAYRMALVLTDTDTKKVTTMTIEEVHPDSFHLRMEDGGTVQMEVISDGKAIYFRQGAGGKFEQAPPAMAGSLASIRQSMASDTALEGVTNVKLDGHETVGGVPATIYTAERDKLGVHTTTRLWIADQTHLPLKTEGDSAGEMKLGNRPAHRVNRHTSATFDYDPSIKVTLPDGH